MAMEIIQSQAVQVDELRATIEAINNEYTKLRNSQSERIAKVENCYKGQTIAIRKENMRLSEVIYSLGAAMAQKDAESCTLKERLITAESKLSNVAEEVKRKSAFVEAIFGLLVANNVPNEQVQAVYSEGRRNQLVFCLEDHEAEIRRLRQRLSLLE
jgi:hypothetical protein